MCPPHVSSSVVAATNGAASLESSLSEEGGAVGLLLRIRHARDDGQGLSPEDTRRLAAAIDEATARRNSMEAAIGLRTGWQVVLAGKIVEDRHPVEGGNVSRAARDLHQRLSRYAGAGHFEADQVRPPSAGTERRRHYDLMLRYGGRVPAERTLREWLTL